jgi:hypothetical protein
MTQGRKCRTVLAISCALAALLTGALLAPAGALAQADQEYNLQIPGAGGGKGGQGGPTATAPTTDNGSGGTPIVLIGLAAVAAACAGVAAWRLRNRDQGRGPKVDQTRTPKVGPPTGAAGATRESQ